MIAQQVAKKYATALFMSVKERGLVDRTYEQFSGLEQLFEQDRSLLTFLGSPGVENERKQELVRSVFGERIEKHLVEFLTVLVDKHRAVYLPEVIDEFNRLVEHEKGISRVTVITAVPLVQTEEDELVSRLTSKTDSKIELEKKVDSSIIGGMIVIMHDRIIDGSVQHGMDLIHEQLQKIKVH